ncbi:MAG: ribbon-helix-helix protein, CopG family [Nitriliruptorales bacterium]
MSRINAQIEIDEELLRWVERRAARSGRSRDDVLEEAVRRGRREASSTVIAARVWERSDLTGNGPWRSPRQKSLPSDRSTALRAWIGQAPPRTRPGRSGPVVGASTQGPEA